MVVSRDWQEVSVLECILGSLHIGVDVVTEPERAWRRFNHSKVDALIVDCDLEGTDRFLRKLKQEFRQPSAVPLVILGTGSGHHRFPDSVTFSFEKPISVEQAVRTLSAARNVILAGRLRYHRQTVNVPVSLSYANKKISAQLLNLSQGGMGVHFDRPIHLQGTVRVMFDLPGHAQPLKAEGEIAWNDQEGNAGIRFVKISKPLREGLQLWLEQRYFAH